jgi:hypothetical protein
VPDVIPALGGCEERKRGGDKRIDVVERAWTGSPKERLQFDECLFDGIEVGTVGWEESEVRAGGFDGRADLGLVSSPSSRR